MAPCSTLNTILPDHKTPARFLLQVLVLFLLAAPLPARGEDLKDFAARLKAENNQGMGDGVTIIASTRLNPKKPEYSKPVELELYAQQGASRLYMDFESGRKKDWGNPKLKPPKGWPTPELDDVIQFINQLHTPDVEVTDGNKLWYSKWSNQKVALISTSTDKGPDVDTPIDYFWPGPSDLKDALGGDKLWFMELLPRADNPALEGLHIIHKQLVKGKTEPIKQWEQTTWLDTSRSDVPTEQDNQNFKPNGDKAHKSTWLILDYAQLPDGRWYANHWHRTDEWGVLEGQLTFLPGRSLPASMFDDPAATRFTSDLGGAPPPPTGIAAVPHAVAATAASMAGSAWTWAPWAVAVAVFGAAGILALLKRRNPTPKAPLRGASGPRR